MRQNTSSTVVKQLLRGSGVNDMYLANSSMFSSDNVSFSLVDVSKSISLSSSIYAEDQTVSVTLSNGCSRWHRSNYGC
jgi:hypothetical protein